MCNHRALLYEQLRHLDTRHFVILECRHLANGCVLKCGCIGLMLFHNLSCLDTIICYINTVGIVPEYACTVCDALVNVHETKWTPHVNRESDVAQSYNSSGATMLILIKHSLQKDIFNRPVSKIIIIITHTVILIKKLFRKGIRIFLIHLYQNEYYYYVE